MKILKFAVSPIAGLIGALKPKKPQLPAPIPTATRDDAAAAIAADDRLRKRRGGAADILNGSSGMEAAAGATAKDRLGS